MPRLIKNSQIVVHHGENEEKEMCLFADETSTQATIKQFIQMKEGC